MRSVAARSDRRLRVTVPVGLYVGVGRAYPNGTEPTFANPSSRLPFGRLPRSQDCVDCVGAVDRVPASFPGSPLRNVAEIVTVFLHGRGYQPRPVQDRKSTR